jgi:hypothetical protein
MHLQVLLKIMNINITGLSQGYRGDAKIAVTSSFRCDGEPDFSQVEVDRRVTNRDRYELFFPKKTVLLENTSLFSNFGYPTIQPFSRRID